MKSLYVRLQWAESTVAGLFLVVMVCLIFLGGVARLVGYPQNWTTDVSTCLFAWACFLCADIAWRSGSLMTIDLATNLLPQKMQRALQWINHGVLVAFLLYLIVAGVWLSWISRIRSFQGLPDISYSWVTMSLPVGAALLLLTTIVKMKELLRC
jgi:TRAP-type C4-dicarboxylate transport system permease small subunit